MSNPTVFVASATGTIGGAVARQLRAINWGVRTTTRNPDSPAAKALADIGVEVTKGSWDDETALEAAISGTQLLFLNLFPDLTDAGHELQQARAIIRIARSAGVSHLVYSSGFRIEDRGVDPGELAARVRASKRRIEEETQAAGFAHWTILRPGFFMANFLEPKVRMYPGATETGVFTVAYTADMPVPLVDHEDVGRFAVAALRDPARFGGREVTVASEIVPLREALAQLSQVAGKTIRGYYLSDEEIEQQKGSNIFLGSQVAARKMAQQADMEEIKGWGIPLTPFVEFLEREKDAVQQTYRNVKE
ncbi:NAD dependent epimerase [Pleurostoma richardsiae]|uniref:NAD dependent epimerase n=1 Tax=Pleurostoma richardsiae TaxID=41990 RepID=A0AA38RVU2_9PEZI|nr:NAD dependent epimerase [Pleurostoma richardsiae]